MLNLEAGGRRPLVPFSQRFTLLIQFPPWENDDNKWLRGAQKNHLKCISLGYVSLWPLDPILMLRLLRHLHLLRMGQDLLCRLNAGMHIHLPAILSF